MPNHNRHQDFNLDLIHQVYERPNGDSEMNTRSNKSVKVHQTISVTPNDYQKPTQFEIAIYDYHEEGGGDRTIYRTYNYQYLDVIPPLKENETFIGFKTSGGTKMHLYYENGPQDISGQQHGWVALDPNGFVHELAVRFDGPGGHDDDDQGLKGKLRLEYVVYVDADTP